MSINIPSNTRTAISLAYIGDASDALAVQEASQILLTDKMRDALKAKVVSAGSLVESIRDAIDLISRMRRYIADDYIAVTAQKIKAANGDAQALAALFMGDGPKLGSKLEDSKSLLDELNAAGFAINAPTFFPVLVTTYDKDGKETMATFSNVSESARHALNDFSLIDSDNSNIKIREQIILPKEKDGPKSTVRYTCYDGYANLRPTQADLDAAEFALSNVLSDLESSFANVLANASKSADRLEEFAALNTGITKEQAVRIREDESQQQQTLIEVLQKLRQLKLDRIFLRQELAGRIDEASQRESGGLQRGLDASMATSIKNSSSRAEAVSPFDRQAERSISLKSQDLVSLEESVSPVKKDAFIDRTNFSSPKFFSLKDTT